MSIEARVAGQLETGKLKTGASEAGKIARGGGLSASPHSFVLVSIRCKAAK
jgi:hypothetical protein